MPDDLSHRKQIEELRQRKGDYVATFGTHAGKKVLADLEDMCFINRTTFSSNQNEFYKNEGMRFVVVHIKNMLNFDLKTLEKLTEEGE